MRNKRYNRNLMRGRMRSLALFGLVVGLVSQASLQAQSPIPRRNQPVSPRNQPVRESVAGDSMRALPPTSAQSPWSAPPTTAHAAPGAQAGPVQVGQGVPAAKPASGPQWQVLHNPDGPHTILLFDPDRLVLAVYHVDAASGSIKLKSIRQVRWDLQIEDYNSNQPSPKDIRSMTP